MQKITDIYRSEYKQIDEFTDTQLEKFFWGANEVKVANDVHDILTNFTPTEKHGVFTTLKLFTKYEMKAGSEFWTGRFMKMFERHEFQSMGSAFGMMELAVHKRFYNKINELLNATDDTFYTDYINDPILKSRMEFIDSVIDDEDDLIALGGFTFIEGVILYSSFAFLKHFQSLGKNKLNNIVRGINFSLRDENLHAVAGAWCYNRLKHERHEEIPNYNSDHVELKLIEMVKKVYEHEEKIIDMIFEKGEIEGITSEGMKIFVKHRINHCLNKINIKPIYDMEGVKDNISSWFYEGAQTVQVNDHFVGVSREYTRHWDEEAFTW